MQHARGCRESYNSHFPPKLVFNVTLLDGLRGFITDDREELLNTHGAVDSRLAGKVYLSRNFSNESVGVLVSKGVLWKKYLTSRSSGCATQVMTFRRDMLRDEHYL